MISISHATEIQDKAGREYKLVLDRMSSLAIFGLYRLGVKIGEAKCVINSTDMLLGDLLICEHVNCTKLQGIQRLLKREPRNYRGLGLGTKLLEAVIELAQNEGIHCLHGSITQEDFDSSPYLLDWYKRHGFQLEMTGEQEVQGAIKRICLYLP